MDKKKKIDTVETRKDIGFVSKVAWNEAPAKFDEHTLKIAGHPVMEDWETSYMQRLAEIATFRGGAVLELGYGMGISAGFIEQNPHVTSHTVIECHPDVAKKAIDDFRDSVEKSTFHLFTGFWEDVTPQMADESFDGILFDTYPLTEEEVHANHFWFFQEAHRLLKKGGILTYYSDEPKNYSTKHLLKLKEAGFHDISFEVCDVDTPADCEYWQYDTMIAPIITK
jgi:guanidinoacetate N-methyltransferase